MIKLVELLFPLYLNALLTSCIDLCWWLADCSCQTDGTRSNQTKHNKQIRREKVLHQIQLLCLVFYTEPYQRYYYIGGYGMYGKNHTMICYVCTFGLYDI